MSKLLQQNRLIYQLVFKYRHENGSNFGTGVVSDLNLLLTHWHLGNFKQFFFINMLAGDFLFQIFVAPCLFFVL